MNPALGRTYIFMGAPGAGKDTQAKRQADRCNGVFISSGDLMRQAKDQDPEIRRIMEAGELVPPHEFERIMSEALAKVDSTTDLFLAGVTKRPEEVPWLIDELAKSGRTITQVIHLEVDQDIGIQRITGRRDERTDDDLTKQALRRSEFDTTTMKSIGLYDEMGLVRLYDANGDFSLLAASLDANI